MRKPGVKQGRSGVLLEEADRQRRACCTEKRHSQWPLRAA